MLSHRQIVSIREDRMLAVGDPTVFAPLRGETLFLTGGTGFMGSWLLEFISALNDEHSMDISVIALSRNASLLKVEKQHLADAKWLTLVNCNIIDHAEIPPQTRWIIHAAGTPDSRVHVSDPVRVIQETVDGTRQILSSAVRLPELKKFLYMSSGHIYGGLPPDSGRFCENHQGGPSTETALSAFAESKRMAETLCYSFKGLYRLPISVVRPFAFVGPYQLLDRPWAMNNFIRDALAGTPIRILGNDQTVRSYMYPSEMARWILTILIRGTDGTSYNLGSSESATLAQIAEMVASFSPLSSTVSSSPSSSKNLPSRFVPDTSRGERDLGLAITINLKDAIRKTIQWHTL